RSASCVTPPPERPRPPAVIEPCWPFGRLHDQATHGFQDGCATRIRRQFDYGDDHQGDDRRRSTGGGELLQQATTPPVDQGRGRRDGADNGDRRRGAAHST